jgi:hypothetical protein
MTRNQLRHLTTTLLLLLLGSGCSQLTTTGNSAPAEATSNQEQVGGDMDNGNSYLHRVQRRGETLILIASWYTGSGDNWRAIARANPELEPLRMQMGERIRIPGSLLRTRMAMPEDYRLLGNRGENPEQPEVGAGPPQKSSASIDLFGPVDSGEQNGGDGQEMKMILESLD